MYCLSIIFPNGKKIKFKISSDETILEKMIENNIEIPFSCEIGTCGTCKVKLEEGEVNMENTSGLLEEEIEKNYILTCQAYCIKNTEIRIEE